MRRAAVTAKYSAKPTVAPTRVVPRATQAFDHPRPRAIIHVTRATSPPAASERDSVVDQPASVDVTEASSKHDDREHRRAAVRAGERDRETGDAERLVQRERQRDVQRVLEAVEEERCARVLQRVERAQREQVDRERHQAQENPASVSRDHGGVTAENAPRSSRATTMGRANAM